MRWQKQSPQGKKGVTSMLVREVMRKPVAVQAEETLQVATARLKQENVGALPVVESDQVVGIITDRDILLRGGGEGRSTARTKARQAMSIAPLVCHESDALDHALAVMRRNHVRRLPVLDQNEKLVGVLSVNDLSAPLSDPAAIEVVFYKQLPDSVGHVHNVELTRVAVARCSSKSEAVQAAIREFEKAQKATRWDLVADGYDVLEHSRRPFEREQRIRERAHALWEREGRPEGRDEEHWAQACREIDREEHAAETGPAGSYENVTPGEAAAQNGIRVQTWAVIGVIALLLMANVVKRRAA
jgi:CBS domain-containing protein